jgi:zinc-finger binding domain of transposase IS66
VTETLELVPRQWKVIQHVREKYSCRACETITQPRLSDRSRQLSHRNRTVAKPLKAVHPRRLKPNLLTLGPGGQAACNRSKPLGKVTSTQVGCSAPNES